MGHVRHQGLRAVEELYGVCGRRHRMHDNVQECSKSSTSTVPDPSASWSRIASRAVEGQPPLTLATQTERAATKELFSITIGLSKAQAGLVS